MKINNFIIPLFVSFSFLVAACSKDNDNDDNNEVTPKTNKEELTAKTWQIGETYQNLSGTRTHYLRGGENTSGVAMEKIRLKFNADGTGSNTDVSGTTYNMTWNFTSADETTLRMTVNGTVVYDWLLTEIKEDAILTTSLYQANGLIVAKWVPVP